MGLSSLGGEGGPLAGSGSAIIPRRIISALPVVLLLCRFSLLPGLHPDWMLVLFFAHTHLTVTVMLCLLLVPKVMSPP